VIPGRAVSFDNRQGQILHGILHEPHAAKARGICVLLLSPGIKGRVGPHRLYLKIAARLVPLGFHVLRFDFHGLGDSEGDLPERALADVYNTVHSGRFVGDTIAAMDWMERTAGVRRFVGSGLCGGAITALLAAEADARIECLLALGLPSVLEGGPENWARVLTHQEAIGLRGSYFQKLTDPASVRRFLTGKSSYKVIWRVVRAWIGDRRAVRSDRPATHRATVDHTNPRFANAFLMMLRSRRPMLLIFAGADRLRAQFAEHFEAHNEALLRDLPPIYEVHIVTDANHVFGEPASVDDLLDASEAWLVSRFSAR